MDVRFFFAQEIANKWAVFYQQQERNPNQPKNMAAVNAAQLAGYGQLSIFSDLEIISTYAKIYSLDPDTVYTKSNVDTVFNLLRLKKENDEYQERFNHYYQKLANENTGHNKRR